MKHPEKSYCQQEVSELITKFFQFLEASYSYTRIIENESSKIFLEGLNVLYTNKKRQRRVTVSYTVSKTESEATYFFVISIIRLPYRSQEDFFSLDEYLNRLMLRQDSLIRDQFDITRARTILEDLSNKMMEYAKEIVEGKDWKSDYYPRKD